MANFAKLHLTTAIYKLSNKWPLVLESKDIRRNVKHGFYPQGVIWFGCVPTQISSWIVVFIIPTCRGRDPVGGNWITGNGYPHAALVMWVSSQKIWWFHKGLFLFCLALLADDKWRRTCLLSLPPYVWAPWGLSSPAELWVKSLSFTNFSVSGMSL